jgi:uncharacterized protein YprB with RNaseH-like and TPR domain
MLKNTFCHIPHVGTLTEKRLWSAGLCDWDAFRAAASPPLSPVRAEFVARHIDESARHLENENPAFFYQRLAARHHWRLFQDFRPWTAYLDIETTGLGSPGDHVTTIALYDGRSVHAYVHGRNLDDFADDVRNYRLLVTYNGKQFDLPFLRNFLGVRLDQAHIDLRFLLASLGYRGGLKGCERKLGLSRGDLEGVDGYFAVLLWQDYQRRANPAALETLLAYNVEDVVNLETLMVLAYNMKLKETPFAAAPPRPGGPHLLPMPVRPDRVFKPDPDTIRRIRREHYFF